jgi:hypothetical protein
MLTPHGQFLGSATIALHSVGDMKHKYALRVKLSCARLCCFDMQLVTVGIIFGFCWLLMFLVASCVLRHYAVLISQMALVGCKERP